MWASTNLKATLQPSKQNCGAANKVFTAVEPPYGLASYCTLRWRIDVYNCFHISADARQNMKRCQSRHESCRFSVCSQIDLAWSPHKTTRDDNTLDSKVLNSG